MEYRDQIFIPVAESEYKGELTASLLEIALTSVTLLIEFGYSLTTA